MTLLEVVSLLPFTQPQDILEGRRIFRLSTDKVGEDLHILINQIFQIILVLQIVRVLCNRNKTGNEGV